MQYPIWHIPGLGGGFLVALISVVHVFVAHFAVGGGLFLVATEWWGYRNEESGFVDFVRRHTKFFLLLSLVFGGVTGVALWFIIALLAPAGTSALVHTFVFAWATEWVFFLGEIIALMVYHYKFATLSRRDHLAVGWAYAGFAWLSLFVINGIIGFMLTPGDWLQTQSFWDGFFNPTFWPSLVFRTMLALLLAGLFAFVTAVRIKDEDTREKLMRWAALWVAAPFAAWLASGWWYLEALPPEQYAMVMGMSRETPVYLSALVKAAPIMLFAALGFAFLRNQPLRKILVWAVLALGLINIGLFEFTREAARRPFIIHGYMYSTGAHTHYDTLMDRGGALTFTGWTRHTEITDDNRMEAGETLFFQQCASCHSVGGVLKDIVPLTEHMSIEGMEAQLTGQGKLLTYMPPFMGTAAEKNALATYIVEGINNNTPEAPAPDPETSETPVPSFDQDEAVYVLVSWADMGLCFYTDTDEWTLLPNMVTLNAQLIRRGPDDGPHVMNPDDADIRFTYSLDDESGAGEMTFDERLNSYTAKSVPATPYASDGSYNPYPLATVRAVDAATGEVLAQTRCVAATSNEMGCRNCHGGKWKGPVAGISRVTADRVVKVHDRINGTDLTERAEAGDTVRCIECHADPLQNAAGRPDLPNLSTALHGWHANFLMGKGADACNMCHPTAPEGSTRALRGWHNELGLDCTDCHGYMEDHSLALLKAEKEAGKDVVTRLMTHLMPRQHESVEDITPRSPWNQEPDCSSCHDHEDYPVPGEDFGFRHWGGAPTGTEADDIELPLYRKRLGDMGAVRCQACHGPTHAIYPSTNPYGDDRDNIAPLQYQGEAGPIGKDGGCIACHGYELTRDEFMHHMLAQ